MKKPTPSSANDPTVTIISISPNRDDHVSLKRIFERSEWSAYTDSKWAIHPFANLQSAVPDLKSSKAPVVLCERDLLPGTWKDALAEASKLPDPPLLIVTSRLADEFLWAEALNLGAYDVLAKPFNPQEVIRTVALASLRRKHGEIAGLRQNACNAGC